MSLCVIPARLRRCSYLLLVAVGMAGAWIWFGNSGLALTVLWYAARPPGQQAVFFLTQVPSQVVAVAPWCVVVVETGVRIEVFRDEVSAENWAWLRRQALALQGS